MSAKMLDQISLYTIPMLGVGKVAIVIYFSKNICFAKLSGAYGMRHPENQRKRLVEIDVFHIPLVLGFSKTYSTLFHSLVAVIIPNTY